METNNLELTDLEKLFLERLITELYAEAGFSDVDVNDMANHLKMSKPSIKGVLGSLVKKGILETYDTGTGYDVILLKRDHWYLHPNWKNDA